MHKIDWEDAQQKSKAYAYLAKTFNVKKPAVSLAMHFKRDSLKAENRTLQERIRELDGELSRMQLTEGLAGGSRNRDKARARVNRLMREVDKCIALLGRPE